MSVSTNSEKVYYIQNIRGTNNLNINNFSDNCQLFIVVCIIVLVDEKNIQLHTLDNLQFHPYRSYIITKISATDYHTRFFSSVGS